jgi:3-oxoacyl-[acyl-carrier protein] reductase
MVATYRTRTPGDRSRTRGAVRSAAMDLGIAGRRAAVGASTAGLGRGAALALVAAGVRVAVCGRDQGRLDAAVDELGRHGEVVGVRADVGTAAGAAAFVEEATALLGGLDILVANAGGPPPGNFASTGLEAYREAVEENLLGAVAMCQAAVPAMRDQGWGRVVAITSVTVRQPAPMLILSNTARAGLTGFLKTLALEVAADGVTVNSVQPGSHDTDRIRSVYGGDLSRVAADVPAGIVGDPDDFGAVVAFLCSEQARFVTGVAVPVDGGAHRGLQ